MTKYLTLRAFVQVGDQKIGRELVDHPIPDKATTQSVALLVADTILGELIIPTAAEILKLLEQPDCPYDFSHTRHWCGNPLCRPS
ncbi:hypothetical protein SEA_EDEN_50 [Microbacterium phage Eden]|uniref:Uncharacterized protein n=1 Tax=Microbacterium phage Eden TaxID=2250289 RepID=A0A345KWE3_9CAUD|nr:hypothetical protein HOT71_gp50 [Microbacterium phage Eden]AXH47345.1 hypothetical protein SEA_EDEN_50 [Microbacterium phage Eden]